MRAVQFLVDTLLSIAELGFMLRLVLQWARADFRNEYARALVDATSPVLVPLRRLLPSIGRIDTASVVVVLALAFARVLAGELLDRLPGIDPLHVLLLRALLELARLFLWTGLVSVIGYSLLRMILQGGYAMPPFVRLLGSLAEPYVRPFRRIPSPATLDLSPLWACILIQFCLMVLPPG